MEETSLKDRISVFRAMYAWSHILEDREIAEILFALGYVTHYGHGTSGHLVYNVVDKLFNVLTEG